MLVKLLITYLKVVIDFIYIWYESKRNTILQTTFQKSKDQDCNRSKLRTLKPLFPQWKTVHFGELSIQFSSVQFSSVQSLSRVWLFATPWIAARQASLSITNSWSLHKLMSIKSVMPSSHLILCHPLLLVPSISPSIKVCSNESTHWGGQSIGVSASASVLPVNTQDWFPLGWTGWISLQSKGLSGVFSNTTVQKCQFSGTQFSSQSDSHIHTWPLEKP